MHKRPPGRARADAPPHDCSAAGCLVKSCPPHACRPLADATTIAKLHFVISGALSAAVRRGWIAINPASAAQKPRIPAPQPSPPTAEQASQIIAAAWEVGPDWGTLVWLTVVTGLRRAELLALRWSDLDLTTGQLRISRNSSW